MENQERKNRIKMVIFVKEFVKMGSEWNLNQYFVQW
jgi:hypothetical protein